nr:PREDICTED: leucine-rich repeat-containing protein 63 [Apteryx mantelli mantelli]
MVEQPKLLRRPLPPKQSSKLSAPREKFGKGKILGQYQTRAIKSTNDENGETVSSSYVSSQGQDKQTDAYLSNDQISHSPVQIFPIQKVEHKGYRYFPCLGPKNSDSACWSLPGIPASEVDQYEIIPVHSSSQIPIQSNVQNIFSVHTPARDFIITKNPSGPDSFPFRKNYRFFRMKRPELQRTGPAHFTPPIFTLEGLAAVLSSHPLPLKTTLKKPVVSHYNCEVLSRRLMTEKRSSQTKVNGVVLSDTDLPLVSIRKSEQQKILEMPLEEKMRKCDSPEENKEKVDTMHYLTPAESEREEGPFTESNDVPDGNTVEDVWKTGFQFAVSKQDEEEELMSRSQLEVLHCLLCQKLALNLQAYFLFRLPDLTPLVDTLVNLNLAFNNLFFFPKEVLNIKTLQVLVLRNNPIREIPNDIYRLESLKKFIISFNLLSELPAGLFLLDNLQHLDIAYNDISFIHNDIKNLRQLEFLNIEGNQLSALPSGVLNLPLKCLRIKNNFIHPLLWSEQNQNQPQKLTHLAALCFSRNNLRERYTDISEDIKKILDDFTVCDCCSGPRYGKGLRLIRLYRNVFRFGRLPFYFHACSSSCHRNFLYQSEA